MTERSAGLAAVLWDMDGTLVDSEKLWDVSLADLARHLGGELSATTRAVMVGGSMHSTLELLFDELALQRRPEPMAEAGRWLTVRTGELFAAGLDWRPGAPQALRMVRATGLPTALVTSTERVLVERALDRIGRENFDVIVCGDEVGATKPAPDPYLTAAGLLGVRPARCVAVEDSPTGAAAAEAAGCAVLVVPSEVPVSPGRRRVHRDGLVGLTAVELTQVLARAVAGTIGAGAPSQRRLGRTGDTDQEPSVAGHHPSADGMSGGVRGASRTPDTCGGKELLR